MFNIPALTFPFHKYLGPGNTLDGDKPVDYDDWIAFLHDIEYLNNNKFCEKIHEADFEACVDTFNDFLTNGNLHSLAGAVGLGFKYSVEKFFNTQF